MGAKNNEILPRCIYIVFNEQQKANNIQKARILTQQATLPTK